jgi:hypothetical protein
MDKEVKELQSEDVRYKTRIAAGAWLNGEQMKEESKATMPLANSDHGDFTKSSIEKSNA